MSNIDIIDIRVAAALITFSGIAAAWAAQVASGRYRDRVEFTSNLVLTVMAMAFAAATLLSLLFLLGRGSRNLLCASKWLDFGAMALLAIFLLVVLARYLRDGLRMMRFGSPGELEIEKAAEREARSLD